MAANHLLVSKNLYPRESVRIGPHGIVNTGEVDVQFATPVFQQLRQQERKLMHRERVLLGPGNLVPHLRMWWCVDRLGYKLVPGVGKDASFGGNGAHQGVEHE